MRALERGGRRLPPRPVCRWHRQADFPFHSKRDEKWGVWHRHPVEDASVHDYSPEGQKEVEFEEFLDEVYTVLQRLALI